MGLIITTNDQKIKGSDQTMRQSVEAALEKLCPAIRITGHEPIVAMAAVNDEKEFCDLLKRNNTGCKLVRDLLMSKSRVSIMYTSEKNGWEHDRVPNRNESLGAYRVHWNPLWSARELFERGEATSGNERFDKISAIAILAHELAHAWNDLAGGTRKVALNKYLPPPPKEWTHGAPSYWNEYPAVLVQNATFHDMAVAQAAAGGPAFDPKDDKAWGRKRYDIKLTKWNEDPFKDDRCSCKQYFAETKKGWGK